MKALCEGVSCKKSSTACRIFCSSFIQCTVAMKTSCIDDVQESWAAKNLPATFGKSSMKNVLYFSWSSTIVLSPSYGRTPWIQDSESPGSFEILPKSDSLTIQYGWQELIVPRVAKSKRCLSKTTLIRLSYLHFFWDAEKLKAEAAHGVLFPGGLKAIQSTKIWTELLRDFVVYK